MAIGPGYKTFTFDGQNSGDYNIGISGQAVYNAPERDVEMIAIPGRNGSYALDRGRFENIEVTYPAAIYGVDQEDFAEKLSDLRNMLASRKGYCRLEDDYNPDEYRLAVYRSGLEVEPVPFQRAGEFEIVFECKPQRFLKSGRTPVKVTSGDTITNPTLFEASPMLEVKGYGDIDIGSETVMIDNVPFGIIAIAEAKSRDMSSFNVFLDRSNALAGDNFTVSFSGTSPKMIATYNVKNSQYAISNSAVGSATNCSVQTSGRSDKGISFEVRPHDATFSLGTPGTYTATATLLIRLKDKSSGTSTTTTVTLTCDISYNGLNAVTFSMSTSPSSVTYTAVSYRIASPVIYCDSTKSSLGDPMYIDLDIGEAYNLDSGTAVSVNNSVTLPAKLPTLQSGNTTITYDNTIEKFYIVPRWWKI